jgi:hypothetical protein
VVAADVHRPLGVARQELELARRLRHLLEDEVGIELDPDVVLDRLAGLPEQLDRLGEHELDAQLADDPPPAAIEHLHRVLAEDLVARHCVDEHGSVTYLAWNKSSNEGRRPSTAPPSC